MYLLYFLIQLVIGVVISFIFHLLFIFWTRFWRVWQKIKIISSFLLLSLLPAISILPNNFNDSCTKKLVHFTTEILFTIILNRSSFRKQAILKEFGWIDKPPLRYLHRRHQNRHRRHRPHHHRRHHRPPPRHRHRPEVNAKSFPELWFRNTLHNDNYGLSIFCRCTGLFVVTRFRT